MDRVPVDAVEAGSFRECMSRVTAAVHIVTAGEVEDAAGVTATAVCSVSDSPSALLFCLHRQGRVRALLQGGSPVAVNTLRASQEDLATVFAGRGKLAMAERFEHGNWHVERGKAPVLADALTSFQCRVESISELGSHSIVVCRVVEVICRAANDALVYGARRYAHFALDDGGVQGKTS